MHNRSFKKKQKSMISELKRGNQDVAKEPFYLKLCLMNARVKMFQKCFKENKKARFNVPDPKLYKPKSDLTNLQIL